MRARVATNVFDLSQLLSPAIPSSGGKRKETSKNSHRGRHLPQFCAPEGGGVTLPSDFWVTIQRYAEMSGYSVGALYQKINRGQLIEERHFRRARDNRILMNIKAMQEWSAGK